MTTLRTTLLRIFLGILVFGLCFGIWILWKMGTTSHRISVDNHLQSVTPSGSLGVVNTILHPNNSSLRTDSNGRINILLLGIAGEHQPGNYLTDTLVVLRINPVTGKIALLSIPRDLYVPIPDTQSSAKINSLYPIGRNENRGIDLTRSAITTITGLDIQYFIVADFDAFRRVIDALGGVTIDVARNIHDDRYPGPNYSYETFTLTAGRQTLDGATALKYVRERHDDPEGDFGRAKRQQQVIQAAREQLFSLKTFLNPFAINSLLDSLGDNVVTDINPEDFPAFIELAEHLDTHNVSTAVIDAWKPGSLLKVVHIPTQSGMMFALSPRTGNWAETHDLAENLFDLDILKRHQDAIATEQPHITILNHSSHTDYTNRLKQLLTDQLGFTAVDITTHTPAARPSSPQNQSFITDATGGTKPWSLDSLLKKFPLTLTTQSPNQTAVPIVTSHQASSEKTPDFIITIGDNMEAVFRYQDASREESAIAEQQANDINGN